MVIKRLETEEEIMWSDLSILAMGTETTELRMILNR